MRDKDVAKTETEGRQKPFAGVNGQLKLNYHSTMWVLMMIMAMMMMKFDDADD